MILNIVYRHLPIRQGHYPIRHEHLPIRYGHSPIKHGYLTIRQGHLPIRQGHLPIRHDHFPVRQVTPSIFRLIFYFLTSFPQPCYFSHFRSKALTQGKQISVLQFMQLKEDLHTQYICASLPKKKEYITYFFTGENKCWHSKLWPKGLKIIGISPHQDLCIFEVSQVLMILYID